MFCLGSSIISSVFFVFWSLIILYAYRCLEEQVKNLKIPQLEEGEKAMGMDKVGNLEGSVMRLLR